MHNLKDTDPELRYSQGGPGASVVLPIADKLAENTQTHREECGYIWLCMQMERRGEEPKQSETVRNIKINNMAKEVTTKNTETTMCNTES